MTSAQLLRFPKPSSPVFPYVCPADCLSLRPPSYLCTAHPVLKQGPSPVDVLFSGEVRPEAGSKASTSWAGLGGLGPGATGATVQVMLWFGEPKRACKPEIRDGLWFSWCQGVIVRWRLQKGKWGSECHLPPSLYFAFNKLKVAARVCIPHASWLHDMTTQGFFAVDFIAFCVGKIEGIGACDASLCQPLFFSLSSTQTAIICPTVQTATPNPEPTPALPSSTPINPWSYQNNPPKTPWPLLKAP